MNWPVMAWSAVPVVSAQVMRQVDESAREIFGIDPRQLMEVAGFQVARFLDEWSGGLAGKRVAVLAGGGNNGGDALVAARFLAQRGAEVFVWTVEARNPDSLPAIHAKTLRAMGISCLPALAGPDFAATELVLDGLLGTGIRLPLRGGAPALIAAVNRARLPVIAIDLPSGLQSDTGEVAGGVVEAAATLSLGLPKPALRAGGLAGRVFLADIGLPPALFGPDREAVAAIYRQGSIVELIASA